MADAFVTGGHTSNISTTININGVANAAPQAVYQSKRTSDNSSGFTYNFPNLVPGTKYTLRLHFGDDQSWKPGMRVFHIDVNDVRAVANFDVFVAAGATAKANVKNIQVTANSSGSLKVAILPVVGNALLNGIEIIP